MDRNPFDIVKAEEFNHGFDELATLALWYIGWESVECPAMDGSRGSIDVPMIQATTYERAAREMVDPLEA